jgi:hypothetical protein
MKKAMLGFLALGLAVASLTVRAESESPKYRYVPADAVGGHDREDAYRRFDWAGGGRLRGDREEWSHRSAGAIRQIGRPRGESDEHHSASVTRTAVAAPEMDPRSAASGLALLLGGIAVLLGRRKLVG